MGCDILLILALAAIFIGLLGDFIQQGPEFFPAAAGQPVRKFIYEGDGIQFVFPHARLQQFF